MARSLQDMIAKLSKDELKDLLASMQTYAQCHRISRTRAQELYDYETSGECKKKIVHFGPLTSQKKHLSQLYTQTFGGSPKDIEFVRDDSLEGGVRMLLGDDMVELSLRDFERHILSTTL